MAQRQQLSPRPLGRVPLLSGLVAFVLVVGLGLGSLGALLWRAPGLDVTQLWQEPYLASVLRFTLWQAGLSTLFSVGLGVPVAIAALLALAQLTVCLGLWGVALAQGGAPSLVAGDAPAPLAAKWRRRDVYGMSHLTDSLSIGGLALLLLPPLIAVVVAGAAGLPDIMTQQRLWPASLRSLGMALCAGLGAVLLALALFGGSGWLRARGRLGVAGVMEGSGQLILVLPALVMGTGLFLLFRPSLGGGLEGYALVVLVNALMALPFAMQVLRGALLALPAAQWRVAEQLGLHGWARFRWLVWPRLRRPLGLALAYAMTLSLGDFSVIALFGSPTAPTLPMLLYQELGGYRWQSAAATAVVLLFWVVATFTLVSALTRRVPRYPWHCSPSLESRHAVVP